MDVDSEEVGRKRETYHGSEMAGGSRITSRKITGTKWPIIERMDASAKVSREKYMKRLVAKWNAENPDAAPLVLEELTEQQRTSLKEEDLAREFVLVEAYVASRMEEYSRVEELDPNQDNDDRVYQEDRERWERKWAKEFGSFGDKTQIPAMCFTDDPMFHITRDLPSMQIFSIKVKEVHENLQWPLDVYGIIAVRDDIDHNRNVIFERTRDNCQTLNEQDPYLVLTGPARAPVILFEPVRLDVMLKVKCTEESEDKDLSLLVRRYECCESINYQASHGELVANSCASSKKFKSKLSTLELTCGIVVSSVEATISVRIVEGSWPDGFSGRFTAFTACVSHMKVLLLNSGDGNVLVSADGTIELSRRVLSVESFGELTICAAACGGSKEVERELFFKPLKSGRSAQVLNIGACKMEITVAWSLFPLSYPTRRIHSSKNG
ncbi:uncharacterized protein LOC100846040 [Brachypodium distachyon]|uniref:DUF6598 domain-containing protein n=1 Tax=Brachypodium distachyon TaxID=15368 RepID=I1GN41_BRADI|nr:uncharacterized protein LOC100846040 [Brachypodium distachyon]KQK13104.1 hypothetical protein BRADI_1g08080v3 [Brachypodium distachyon]|eukprot:XP_003559406.1 uncharacterized protein LOC100846040 [Brachypodium distachyon]